MIRRPPRSTLFPLHDALPIYAAFIQQIQKWPSNRFESFSIDARFVRILIVKNAHRRSEEHTSELQSLAYFVCRLLLEKKIAGINTSTSAAVTPAGYIVPNFLL